MLFLFESSWLPIVGLFVSSETPGPGCFPWEGAGGMGGEGEQASTVLCRGPVITSPVPALLLCLTVINPAPGTQMGGAG